MARSRRALPGPTPETQPYWDAARQHRLLLRYCPACDAYDFYPRPFCRRCFSWDVAWREASGQGSIYTYVINYRPAPGFEDRAPYVIAVIELAEGPKMMANVWMDETPTPENVRIGMPVEVMFDDLTDEISLPQFRPVR